MTLITQPFKHLQAFKDRVSAGEFNRAVDLLSSIARSLVSYGFMDSTGLLTRRQPVAAVAVAQPSADLWIFEVQSVTATDGIYNCYKQTVFGIFEPPSIEVLNLIENDTLDDYTPTLAHGDRIVAYQTPDEVGVVRWVGISNTPSVRMARTTEAAGSETHINCNLIANDGISEITSGLGSGIDVYCRITRDISLVEYDLDSALPRLENGDYIFVQNISGKWWCTTVFQVNENCVCSQE